MRTRSLGLSKKFLESKGINSFNKRKVIKTN